MKSIKHPLNSSQYIVVKCLKCGKEKLINKHYYKKNKHKYRTFCSEMCRIYYDDPAQENIMNMQDTTDFYYLVGLICTDGHIGYPGCTRSTKSYYCNIKLNQEDKELLYGIQKKFGGTITVENDYKVYSWRVSNKEFVDYLMKMGITNTKTYNIDVKGYFDNLTDKNKLAFLRGVIDGDGSISIQNRMNRKHPCGGFQCGFNICSASKTFISMISEYFKIGILTERKAEKNLKATCSLYYYYINGEKIVAAINDIYNTVNDELVMKRKQEAYYMIKEYYNH